MRGDGEEKPYRFQTRNGREHLLKVNASALHVPLHHQASLVLGDVAVGVALDLEHPLEPDGTVPAWEIDEYLGVILLDGR